MPLVIASGDQPDVLARLLAGNDLGPIFLPATTKLAKRKRWIAFFQRPAGVLVVDDGARAALRDGGKSLLAKGVVRREGTIIAGDVVSIRDSTGVEFARGIVRDGNTLVHRDDLVVL
jgi:glutamate 5-kinase